MSPVPRFSVIVPAYKVQAYLHDCLDSVLTQSFRDLELIAVDDCSPDACGAIADEFAARDPRVRPVHLPENSGPAVRPATPAWRSRAATTCSSWTATTPSPRAPCRRSPTGSRRPATPTSWSTTTRAPSGRARPSATPVALQLTEQGPAPFRLDDRPGLLKVLMVVWNKAYRREFLEREGFTFPPGYYEDTPWTYPVLMAAESIATLDRVCVHYRQRPPGQHHPHDQPPPLRRLRPVRPAVRVCRRPPRTGPLAPGAVPPHGRPPRGRVHPARAGCRAAPAPSSSARPAPTTRRYRGPPGARPPRPRTGCGTRSSGWAATARTALLSAGARVLRRTGRLVSLLAQAMPARSAPPPLPRPAPPPPARATGRCSPRTGAAATPATRPRWRTRSAPSRPVSAPRGSLAPSTTTRCRRRPAG